MSEYIKFQKDFEDFLKGRGIPYFHLHNRMFMHYKRPNWAVNFPDIFFPYGNNVHIWEFGDGKGAHKDRKKKQYAKAMLWWSYAPRAIKVRMIYELEEYEKAKMEVFGEK